MKLSGVTRLIRGGRAVHLGLPVSKACLTAGEGRRAAQAGTPSQNQTTKVEDQKVKGKERGVLDMGQHRGSTAGMKVQLQPLPVSAHKNPFLTGAIPCP